MCHKIESSFEGQDLMKLYLNSVVAELLIFYSFYVLLALANTTNAPVSPGTTTRQSRAVIIQGDAMVHIYFTFFICQEACELHKSFLCHGLSDFLQFSSSKEWCVAPRISYSNANSFIWITFHFSRLDWLFLWYNMTNQSPRDEILSCNIIKESRIRNLTSATKWYLIFQQNG